MDWWDIAWNASSLHDFGTVNGNAIVGLGDNCHDGGVVVDAGPSLGLDIVLVAGADVEGVAGRGQNKRPGSAQLGCGMEPWTKGLVEVAMEVGECVKESAPNCPGGFVRAFLVYLL